MELSLTLYRGATVDEPVEGIYSFVPARCADHDQPRFARPPVHLPGLVNPASRQSTWGSKRPLPMERLRDAWEALCHQVLAADLVLATRLQTPDGDTDEGIAPERRPGNAADHSRPCPQLPGRRQARSIRVQ